MAARVPRRSLPALALFATAAALAGCGGSTHHDPVDGGGVPGAFDGAPGATADRPAGAEDGAGAVDTMGSTGTPGDASGDAPASSSPDTAAGGGPDPADMAAASDGPGSGAPADTGPAPDVPAGVACQGVYAGFTRTQLGMAALPAGKCAQAADLDRVCADVPSQPALTCASVCYLSLMQTGTLGEATLSACTSECIVRAVPGLSAGCIDCYAHGVSCVALNCAAQCFTGPTSPECRACETANQCTSTFATCSGLPNPT
jgi:hypothetical protein